MSIFEKVLNLAMPRKFPAKELREIKTNTPNFFIIGVPKAGTSALYYYCSLHPDIFMCEPKEPGFFITFDPKYVNNYTIISSGDRKWDVCRYFDYQEYLSLFQNTDKAVRGEATTGYLLDKNSAPWIKKLFPDAKLVAVLRNPIERMISEYNMLQGLGHETFKSRDQAFDRIISSTGRVNEADLEESNIIKKGLYADSVAEYQRYFDKDHFLILDYHEFNTHTKAVLNNIFNFLSVREFTPRKLRRLNTSEEWINRSKERKIEVESIDPMVLDQIKNYYKNDVTKLQALVQFDVMKWVS